MALGFGGLVAGTLGLVDLFGPLVTDFAEPHRLCTRASIDGSAPGAADPDDSLRCCRARARASFGTVPVALLDAFGRPDVTPIRRQEVSAPATVGVP